MKPNFKQRVMMEEVDDYLNIPKEKYETVYLDNSKDKNPTAGFGIKLPGYKAGQRVPKEVLDQLFERRYQDAERGAEAYLPGMRDYDQRIQEVLTDMAFNMGADGLGKFKDMREGLAKKDYAMAARELMDSDYARQVPNRAKRNQQLILDVLNNARNTAVQV